MGVQEFFSEGGKIFCGEEKFEMDGLGTNEGTENKNRTAKSVNILISFKFIRFFL